jgi:DNA-binding IclR family transcriptional regulator
VPLGKSSSQDLREQRDIGRELPAHATALGRVLLSHLPKQQMLEFIRECGLAQYTPRTVVSEPELIDELDLIRRQGYSIVDGEYYAGTCAVSVPIFGSQKNVREAISVSGDRTRPIWKDPHSLIDLLKAEALEISRKLKD